MLYFAFLGFSFRCGGFFFEAAAVQVHQFMYHFVM